MNKRVKLDSSYFEAAQDTGFQHGNTLQSPIEQDQHGQPSAEVAADFKDSLQDLTMNNRYEIGNLTVIAKESTEHALAISRVLEDHIRTTAPPRKLPAFYVLDSIVKNVGTPYTIYFAQNLYKTFMEAYTLVDNQTRRAMENMLKLWKEPPPGSMEARPVFPVEVTRSIENALIKARTLVVQQQQQQARFQRSPFQNSPAPSASSNYPVPGQYRNTPTPPQSEERRGTPLQTQPQYQALPASGEFQFHRVTQASTPFNAQPPQYPTYPHQLSQTTPVNPTPPPPAVPQIDLAALLKAVGGQIPAVSAQQPIPQQQQQQPQQQHQQQQQQQQQPSFSALPGLSFPGLGALLQRSTPTHSTPQPVLATGSQLGLSRPSTAGPYSTPPLKTAHIARPLATSSDVDGIVNDVKLTSASLKTRRSNLVTLLYSSQPNQCGTCGRRFGTTEIGKARKGRHLDWHFRTNMRLVDAARRGVTRNWYMDELEWIRSREIDEADETAAAAAAAAASAALGKQSGSNDSSYYGIDTSSDNYGEGNNNSGSGTAAGRGSKSRERYVKAPTDAAIVHHACPICQDEFKTTWHEGAQEWVWMDTVRVGGKVYHASCMEELAKDRGSAPISSAANATSASIKSNTERTGSLKRELPLA